MNKFDSKICFLLKMGGENGIIASEFGNLPIAPFGTDSTLQHATLRPSDELPLRKVSAGGGCGIAWRVALRLTPVALLPPARTAFSPHKTPGPRGSGGGCGIRTHGYITASLDFESSALNQAQPTLPSGGTLSKSDSGSRLAMSFFPTGKPILER